MKTISVKDLRPVKMMVKTLVFEDPNHETYMATRRVANDILMGIVDEVFIVDTILHNNESRHIQMLATPSCW